ncbi:opsin-5 [Patagioenas fasciata monilis]|uniref:Opsin-5 n=1 Tax=Patagioenas fasciata monilis TaxID=372326 RepID=A0A1V4JNA5_PATFA|nr:opsin-5 [Patagioenas fasciata monilis]
MSVVLPDKLMLGCQPLLVTLNGHELKSQTLRTLFINLAALKLLRRAGWGEFGLVQNQLKDNIRELLKNIYLNLSIWQSHLVNSYSFGPMTILTVLGNSVVLATAVKRSSLLKSPELLTVNLAVADIGMAISMYPLAIASAWNHAWLGGDVSCIYYALMGFLFGVCSMMTLCAMAVIRFLVTNSSKSNSSKITKNAVRFVITSIWLYSLLWAILPLVGWGYYGPEPFGISCTIAWSKFHNSSNGFSFILSMFLLCTVLPALTIVACYLGIAWKVHKAYQEIQNIDRIPHAAKLEKKLTLVSYLAEKSLK